MSITSNITSSITSSITESITGSILQAPIFDGFPIGLQLASLQQGLTKDQLFNISGVNKVEDWIGYSANGRTASQGTDSARPLYIPSSINGRPGVKFDGSNDILITDYFPTKGDYTIFYVIRTVDTVAVILGQDVGGFNNLDSLLGIGAGSRCTGTNGTMFIETHGTASGEDNCLFTDSAFNDDIPHIVTSTIEGNTYTIDVDGVTKSEGGKTQSGFFGSNGSTSLVIGNNAAPPALSRWFNGYIGEILIYAGALSLNDRNKVTKEYLSPKWGIA